jgi:hypothetical protein
MNIDLKTAKKLYPESNDWFKKQLEKEFGEDNFKPKDYESINTLEDVYQKTGVNPKNVIRDYDTPDEIAYKLLKLVVLAINPVGWVADYKNSIQRKWFPVFDLSSGFGFSGSGYGCTGANTGTGSLLVFESEERANYAATHPVFSKLYEQFITLKK